MAETGGNGLDWALGSMDARVTMLEKRVAVVEREIKEALEKLSDKNDKLNAKIDQLGDDIIASRSSWKAIVWFVGIVATASTVIATLYQVGVIR